jgi:hypothetical protein
MGTSEKYFPVQNQGRYTGLFGNLQHTGTGLIAKDQRNPHGFAQNLPPFLVKKTDDLAGVRTLSGGEEGYVY